MKKAKVVLLCMIGVLYSITGYNNVNHLELKETPAFYYSEKEVKNRIENSASLLASYYEPTVQFFVKDNLYQGKKGFARTLVRTEMYFPIIEQYLQQYALPDDLKYLIVVESQADPHASSGVGAVGLWQLMPKTAMRYGLTVNEVQDDRKDPYKATEAAIKYLMYLHDFLGNWPLAIAAYNCGEGRVRRAVREVNTTDYDKVKHLLPKQTQKYIPAIIAARYSVNHYFLHEVALPPIEYSVKFTTALKVFDKLTFAQISNITNIPVETITTLNPSYRKKYVPASKQGNYIILPASEVSKLEHFLNYADREIAYNSF